MMFFPGLHHPADAKHFERSFISINALRRRKADFGPGRQKIIDSGAFTIIEKFGHYPEPPRYYAKALRRWCHDKGILAAVSQDYMCEAVMLRKTGLTIPDHQRLTIERYDALKDCDLGGIHLMPVLQGYTADDYARHIAQYGRRLAAGAWVGVGSVCKRNGNPAAIENVLLRILAERPDLRLHGFGVKLTALLSEIVYDALYSADSMAWSFAARREGRNANDWREAEKYRRRIDGLKTQRSIFQVLA